MVQPGIDMGSGWDLLASLVVLLGCVFVVVETGVVGLDVGVDVELLEVEIVTVKVYGKVVADCLLVRRMMQHFYELANVRLMMLVE